MVLNLFTLFAVFFSALRGSNRAMDTANDWDCVSSLFHLTWRNAPH